MGDPRRPPDRATDWATDDDPRRPTHFVRTEDGLDLPLLVWRLADSPVVCSSAPVGGGLGRRGWIVNAQVRPGYARMDLAAHAGQLADHAGLDPHEPGVVMFTAAEVDAVEVAEVDGVRVEATVGVRAPVWAADEDAPARTGAPVAGTINVVAFVPAPLTDAALVNAVATATEAKTQALLECGICGTGTVTDTICVVAPADGRGPDDGGDPPAEMAFGGPRSRWGAPLARAVHTAVAAGTRAGQDRYCQTDDNEDDVSQDSAR